MLRPTTTLRPILRTTSKTLRPRSFNSGSRSPRATQDFDLNKLNSARRDYEHNRTAFLAAGALAGTIAFIYTGYKLKQALDAQKSPDQNKKEMEKTGIAQCDAPAIPAEQFKTEAGEKRKVVVRDEQGREIVPTGNSVVQAFPRTMDLMLPYSSSQAQGSPIAATISDTEGTEFTLVGLGMRSVTFLGIQVYLLGFYVATQDIAKLQHYLVKKVNPLATTLIPSEKEALRKSLLDAVEGEETWDGILRDAGVRSAFRITPVKDTDFHHLRDGFVRAIQARSNRDKAYGDEAFGEALRGFKGMFNRGSVPKRRELVLCRDNVGRLSVLYDEAQKDSKEGSAEGRDVMGVVGDERVSRLLWLNYLAGSKVASEGARQNIISGVMEFVERPVGTVATQVL